MKEYYSEKLSARRLMACYALAPPRVRQYLEAETDHVLAMIHPGDIVLELGCGYGRILPLLARKARFVIGIDISDPNIRLGRELLHNLSNCLLLQMNATELLFPDHMFDVVVCIQNGISAFHVDQRILIKESLRVTRNDGKAIFTSYSERFWDHRLEWFRLQSDAGLLGRIDEDKTHNGTIVCDDGFTAITVAPQQFDELCSGLKNISYTIEEVDESSVCMISPKKTTGEN
jgi:ubiquinone/menaquinone biosynthesis C-methylase UbiE